jgi:glycosyltransferase involved in cell wall biosynthesis/peptidoglycan/xylan/chitin deacetylase (PgdA/CDA1 family)
MSQLSVIIPTYNRAEMLRACLEALCQQTLPATDFEVIVVVDGSTDGTRQMLVNLAPPFELRAVWQENSGPGAARNRGVEAAAGRYCLFLDDDIIADPGLVAEHLRVQRARQGVVGLGRLTLIQSGRTNGFTRFVVECWNKHYARLDRARSPSFMDCYSGNMSVPRSAFTEAGGFAVDLPRCEDIEFGYRLERQGLSFVYIPEAVGQQHYHKRFCEPMADNEKAGIANVEMYRRHPSMLPAIRLGRFGATLREVLLGRFLLAIGLPSRFLAVLGLLLGRSPWAHKWYHHLWGYAFWRGVRRAVPDRDTWHRLTCGPVILMYHAFGAPGEPPSRYIVPVRRFARQMAWLKWRGYHILSLEEFLCYRREHSLPPARSVVITIDDGYVDTRTLAYPVLRRYGFPATIFLISGLVGATNRWDGYGELAGRPLLSWSDIREMLHDGIRFGAHSRTHALLTAISPSRVEDEVDGSRADLERELGLPILTFAYPYGEYDPLSQMAVERAGFLGACSAHDGVNAPAVSQYALRRVEVRGPDSLATFALALESGKSHAISALWRGRWLHERRHPPPSMLSTRAEGPVVAETESNDEAEVERRNRAIRCRPNMR